MRCLVPRRVRPFTVAGLRARFSMSASSVTRRRRIFSAPTTLAFVLHFRYLKFAGVVLLLASTFPQAGQVRLMWFACSAVYVRCRFSVEIGFPAGWSSLGTAEMRLQV